MIRLDTLELATSPRAQDMPCYCYLTEAGLIDQEQTTYSETTTFHPSASVARVVKEAGFAFMIGRGALLEALKEAGGIASFKSATHSRDGWAVTIEGEKEVTLSVQKALITPSHTMRGWTALEHGPLLGVLRGLRKSLPKMAENREFLHGVHILDEKVPALDNHPCTAMVTDGHRMEMVAVDMALESAGVSELFIPRGLVDYIVKAKEEPTLEVFEEGGYIRAVYPDGRIVRALEREAFYSDTMRRIMRDVGRESWEPISDDFKKTMREASKGRGHIIFKLVPGAVHKKDFHRRHDAPEIIEAPTPSPWELTAVDRRYFRDYIPLMDEAGRMPGGGALLMRTKDRTRAGMIMQVRI